MISNYLSETYPFSCNNIGYKKNGKGYLLILFMPVFDSIVCFSRIWIHCCQHTTHIRRARNAVRSTMRFPTDAHKKCKSISLLKRTCGWNTVGKNQSSSFALLASLIEFLSIDSNGCIGNNRSPPRKDKLNKYSTESNDISIYFRQRMWMGTNARWRHVIRSSKIRFNQFSI